MPIDLPKVTTATEWRKKSQSRWLIALPSGVIVKARRPDWGQLIHQGVINAEELLEVSGSTDAGTAYTRTLPIARKIVPHVVTEPVIVMERLDNPDVIHIDDIPEMDILILFSWANGGAQSLGAQLIEDEVAVPTIEVTDHVDIIEKVVD